jgi:hypothetical protein
MAFDGTPLIIIMLVCGINRNGRFITLNFKPETLNSELKTLNLKL